MFKKTICITAVLFMLTGITGFTVFAQESKTHTYAENNFSIDLPSDWGTVTKDTPESDIAFKDYGFTYSEVQKNFFGEADGIFCGYAKDVPIEINLYSWQTQESISYSNFKYNKHEYKDWEQNTIFNMEDPEYSETTTNTFIKSHHTPQAIFFIFESKYKNEDGKCISGITIVNGRFYQIDLYSYNGEITNENVELFDKTLDNFKFLKLDKKSFNFDTLVVVMPFVFASIIVLSFIISVIMRIAKNNKKNKITVNKTSNPETKTPKQKRNRKNKDEYPNSPDL